MTVRCLCFSKDTLYSGSDDMTILSYDPLSSNPTVLKPFCNHTGWVTGLAVSPDEQFMVSWQMIDYVFIYSSTDKKVVIWPLKEDCTTQSFNVHDGIVWSVDFNKDGTRIVSIGDDGSIQVYQRQ